jgi:hypothetical protein
VGEDDAACSWPPLPGITPGQNGQIWNSPARCGRPGCQVRSSGQGFLSTSPSEFVVVFEEEPMSSTRAAKAQAYTRYPVSSLLIYNLSSG